MRLHSSPADRLLHCEAGAHWKRLGACHHHGIALPLFSLHSSTSVGIGEYLDLIPLIDWVKAVGMDTIQLLPLNDTGHDPSPYNALSALALNPIYLKIPGAPHYPLPPRVDYAQTWALKEPLLRQYIQDHPPDTAPFIEDNPWVLEYANFKSPHDPDFEIALQVLCHTQLSAVKAHGDKVGVRLLGDIPILVGRHSHSVHHQHDLFDLTKSIGAPPDPYAIEGQNWEVPLYNWKAHEADDFRWWRQRLASASQYYHAYRIDHVLGLFRFWVLPPGAKGTQGHYIPDTCREWLALGLKLLRMMLDASPLLPIGEDIGKVPHEIPRALDTLGVPNTRFIPWLYPWSSGQDYSPASLSLLSTHDSEPFRLWWLTNPDAKSCADFHNWTLGQPLTFDQHFTLLRESHHTSSLFHINPLQEYLALFPDLRHEAPQDERINTPGTNTPLNWTYRFIPSVEHLHEHTQLQETIQQIVRSSV